MVVELIFVIEVILGFLTGRYVGINYYGRISDVAYDYVRSGHFFFDSFTSIPVAWVEYIQRIGVCGAQQTDPNGVQEVTLLR